jgi:hypothetical protein
VPGPSTRPPSGLTDDGTRAWFVTAEPIPSVGDTDANFDVFERAANGDLRIISPPGNGAFDAFLIGSTPDGSRVFFTTEEPNPLLADTDSERDIYERSADGTLRLISIPGAGAFAAMFDRATPDGSRVWFSTFEPSPAMGDTDAELRVGRYRRTGRRLRKPLGCSGKCLATGDQRHPDRRSSRQNLTL